MDHREIQRLSAADMTPSVFREFAEHGEDLLVERKAQIPEPERLGAVVSSMANMLGGWILLGVEDRTRQLVPLELKGGIDLQSHIGNLLRKVLDPVPPFLAGTLVVDGSQVGFIRVFKASAPVLVRGSGAVYSRDAGGKRPISDHRELLELARAGEEAEKEARERPHRNALNLQVLGLPPERHPIAENHLRIIVRAAPLSVTPQLREWPISKGPNVCLDAARSLAERFGAPEGFSTDVRPFGRAVAVCAAPLQRPPLNVTSLHTAVTFADCAGVFGVAASRGIANVLTTTELRRESIRPCIEAVARLLIEAEAFGDAVFDLHLFTRRDLHLDIGDRRWKQYRLREVVSCGSPALPMPASEEDRAELAKYWEREVAREAGIPIWEEPQGVP